MYISSPKDITEFLSRAAVKIKAIHFAPKFVRVLRRQTTVICPLGDVFVECMDKASLQRGLKLNKGVCLFLCLSPRENL